MKHVFTWFVTKDGARTMVLVKSIESVTEQIGFEDIWLLEFKSGKTQFVKATRQDIEERIWPR